MVYLCYPQTYYMLPYNILPARLSIPCVWLSDLNFAGFVCPSDNGQITNYKGQAAPQRKAMTHYRTKYVAFKGRGGHYFKSVPLIA
jgi:hypothetical protein